jgi:hypothetical protein
MRALNLDEFLEKFENFTYKIQTCQPNDTTVLIDQLIYFLLDQHISKRIIERVRLDFTEINETLQNITDTPTYKEKKSILPILKSDEIQGAFSLLLLVKLYQSLDLKHDSYYIKLGMEWYDGGSNYYEWQNKFNTYFFIPFINLINWYCYESRPKDDRDYFSMDTKKEVTDKLDEILQKFEEQGFANQIIFSEVEELGETLMFLNKRSWIQLMTAKLTPSASSMIPSETIEDLRDSLIEFIKNL